MALTWSLRLLTFAVWAAVAWSATFWGLKHLQADSSTVQAPSVAAPPVQAGSAELQRVFGKTVAQPVVAASAPIKAADPAARFALLGVVTGRGDVGVALLSVDGKAARPFRVGSEVEDGLKLVKVAAREATLSGKQGEPTFTLELPRAGGGRPPLSARPAPPSTPSAAASAARPAG